MATFLEQSENCIYQADCREVLKQIPSETVDLIIADPPYYLGNCETGSQS